MSKPSLIALLLLVLSLGGCTVPGGPGQLPKLTIQPDEVTIEPGDSVAFKALLEPSANHELGWHSDDGSLTVAGVNAVYRAPVEVGKYSVTVSLAEGEVSARAAVTVSGPTLPQPSITLTPAAGPAVAATGTTIELVAQVDDRDAAALQWSTDGGRIEADGERAHYTAPLEPGRYLVSATLPESGAFGVLEVDVPGGILEPFTIAVIPDTQTLVRYAAAQPLVRGIGQWLVDNVEERGIAFVTQVGDVVWHPEEWPTSELQWEAALAGFDLLDGVVPYSVALGDHEYYPEEDKAGSTEPYLSRFGPERYAAHDWYGGSHPDGLSHFQLFEAGGRQFLHLALEWEPLGPASDPTTPLGWARTVLEAHPDVVTFITTHAYLWDMPGQEGHFPDDAREGYLIDKDVPAPTTSGAGIFEALVEPFPQVLMVFNGHYHKAQDTQSRGEYHQVSENAAGLPVYEMLANYQWMPYGDDPDWIRLIEFVPGTQGEPDLIEVTTFSPSRAGTPEQYLDWPSSSFTFEFSLAERFAPTHLSPALP